MKKYKTTAEFFADQETEKLEQVMAIREVLFNAEPKLIESIKWNAPNYSFHGEDRITFNLMNKESKVKIIIHMGATKKEDKQGEPAITDPDGLVEWNSDIRGMILFNDMEDVKAKRSKFKKLIKSWLLVGQ